MVRPQRERCSSSTGTCIASVRTQKSLLRLAWTWRRTNTQTESCRGKTKGCGWGPGVADCRKGHSPIRALRLCPLYVARQGSSARGTIRRSSRIRRRRRTDTALENRSWLRRSHLKHMHPGRWPRRRRVDTVARSRRHLSLQWALRRRSQCLGPRDEAARAKPQSEYGGRPHTHARRWRSLRRWQVWTRTGRRSVPLASNLLTEKKFNEHYETIASFKAHDGLILASAFTKYNDKPTLVTGGNDNTIVIWEVKDCAEPNAITKRNNNGTYVYSDCMHPTNV